MDDAEEGTVVFGFGFGVGFGVGFGFGVELFVGFVLFTGGIV